MCVYSLILFLFSLLSSPIFVDAAAATATAVIVLFPVAVAAAVVVFVVAVAAAFLSDYCYRMLLTQLLIQNTI